MITTGAVSAEKSSESGVVWLLEPEFKYDIINYCKHCDLFNISRYNETFVFKFSENISDLKTEMLKYTIVYDDETIAWICEGHGFCTNQYFIDEEKQLIIILTQCEAPAELSYLTFDEFKEYDNGTLIVFQKIDSDKIKSAEDGYNFDEAYIDGKYAIAHGMTFITDFIYDDYKAGGYRHESSNFIDVKLNGKWGIIDKDGKIAAPFVFDDSIEFIDDSIAFAEYNGKYGILDVEKTAAITKANTVSSPVTGENNFMYIFIVMLVLLFISVSLVKIIREKRADN